MNIKQRLILAVAFLWIFAIIFCLGSGAGTFFSQMSNGTTELYSLEVSKMQKSMPINGECYMVYDILASSVTEETSKYTGRTKETTNAYYYIIPLSDEEYCMLLKTSANSDMTRSADVSVDLFWEEDSTIEDLIAHSFKVDGILTKNDSEIVGFYNEWVSQVADGDEGLKLAPYTLDCTKPVTSRIKEFWAGSVLLIALVGSGIFLIARYFSGRRQTQSSVPVYSPSAPVSYGNDYSNLSGQSQNRYDPTETFTSNSSSGASDNFQSQGGSANSFTYGQQSSSNSYGSQNDFVVQGSRNYGSYGSGSYNSYQSQGSFTQQNPFTAQSGTGTVTNDEQDPNDSYTSQNGYDSGFGNSYGNDDYNRF